MSKPTHVCSRCGQLAPDLVVRDHKRPTCALCGGEATPTMRKFQPVTRYITPSGEIMTLEDVAIRHHGRFPDGTYTPVPPGVVSSRTWAPDGRVYDASQLERALREES